MRSYRLVLLLLAVSFLTAAAVEFAYAHAGGGQRLWMPFVRHTATHTIDISKTAAPKSQDAGRNSYEL